jgi:hypothetical protein
MNTLQRFFDRLVGIARYEAGLRHKANQVFCAPALDFIPFESPACWRRQSRIQAIRRS